MEVKNMKKPSPFLLQIQAASCMRKKSSFKAKLQTLWTIIHVQNWTIIHGQAREGRKTLANWAQMWAIYLDKVWGRFGNECGQLIKWVSECIWGSTWGNLGQSKQGRLSNGKELVRGEILRRKVWLHRK